MIHDLTDANDQVMLKYHLYQCVFFDCFIAVFNKNNLMTKHFLLMHIHKDYTRKSLCTKLTIELSTTYDSRINLDYMIHIL